MSFSELTVDVSDVLVPEVEEVSVAVCSPVVVSVAEESIYSQHDPSLVSSTGKILPVVMTDPVLELEDNAEPVEVEPDIAEDETVEVELTLTVAEDVVVRTGEGGGRP